MHPRTLLVISLLLAAYSCEAFPHARDGKLGHRWNCHGRVSHLFERFAEATMSKNITTVSEFFTDDAVGIITSVGCGVMQHDDLIATFSYFFANSGAIMIYPKVMLESWNTGVAVVEFASFNDNTSDWSTHYRHMLVFAETDEHGNQFKSWFG